jgi:hypothetical protein
MDRIINVDLIKNPVNWIIVALMLAVATFALHLLLGDDRHLMSASGSAGQGDGL